MLEQAVGVIDAANRNRVTSATAMNDASSRSHSVLVLDVQVSSTHQHATPLPTPLARALPNTPCSCPDEHPLLALGVQTKQGARCLRGKLHLVDLAGSERVKKSEVIACVIT